MRILDDESDKKLDRVTIYLTRSEAEELCDRVVALLENPAWQHSHLSAEDFQKELTICVYREEDLRGFDDRSKRLILEDE